MNIHQVSNKIKAAGFKVVTVSEEDDQADAGIEVEGDLHIQYAPYNGKNKWGVCFSDEANDVLVDKGWTSSVDKLIIRLKEVREENASKESN